MKFGATTALQPTDIRFVPSATTALVGPSGSGKSTLLRVLAGLIPANGTVRFAEAPVVDWRAVRLKLGYVIQDGGLFPHLTAAENVTLMARELGWPAEQIAARSAELAEIVGLPEAPMARFPAELSGGQRQRVSIMRALMLDPEVVLLDEPLSALDPITRARLAQELHRIFSRLSKTVILVTHSLREARFFAGHIVLMRRGRIVQQGSYDELEQAPAEPFVSEFIAAERTL
ncbi:MAG: ATP-binding cassette domain-containing protein [Steroidobacteraceae bacterium]